MALGLSAQSYTRFSYPISMGVGSTSDYISNTSWLGMHIEFGHAIHRNSHFGLESGWVTLYDKLPNHVQEFGNTAVRGTQYRYINVIPILAKYTQRFDLTETTGAFLAGGAGISYAEQRTDVGIFSVIDDAWPFTVSPEAGFTFESGPNTLFTVSAYYTYLAKTSTLDNISYFGIRLGFAWE